MARNIRPYNETTSNKRVSNDVSSFSRFLLWSYSYINFLYHLSIVMGKELNIIFPRVTYPFVALGSALTWFEIRKSTCFVKPLSYHYPVLNDPRAMRDILHCTGIDFSAALSILIIYNLNTVLCFLIIPITFMATIFNPLYDVIKCIYFEYGSFHSITCTTFLVISSCATIYMLYISDKNSK